MFLQTLSLGICISVAVSVLVLVGMLRRGVQLLHRLAQVTG